MGTLPWRSLGAPCSAAQSGESGAGVNSHGHSRSRVRSWTSRQGSRPRTRPRRRREGKQGEGLLGDALVLVATATWAMPAQAVSYANQRRSLSTSLLSQCSRRQHLGGVHCACSSSLTRCISPVQCVAPVSAVTTLFSLPSPIVKACLLSRF